MKKEKLTAKEKRERAEARAWLREQGVLPPTKKRLNRKQFCENAKAALDGETDMFGFGPYIVWALYEVLGRREWPEGTVSLEAVGAAKVIRLAEARRDFEAAKREAGEVGFTLGELLEAVEGIYNA